MEYNLSDCPFCSDVYVFIRREEQLTVPVYWVQCRHCGAQGGASHQKEHAVSLWEKRTQIQKDHTPTLTLGEALEWQRRLAFVLSDVSDTLRDAKEQIDNFDHDISKHFKTVVDRYPTEEENPK